MSQINSNNNLDNSNQDLDNSDEIDEENPKPK
jgi:hypothetical protein